MRTSNMRLSLFPQQGMSCLPHPNCSLEGREEAEEQLFVICCSQDLFKITHNILIHMYLPSICFVLFKRFDKFLVILSYNSTDKSAAWNNARFISSVKSNFHMVTNLFNTYDAFPMRMSTSLLEDVITLPRNEEWSTYCSGYSRFGFLMF